MVATIPPVQFCATDVRTIVFRKRLIGLRSTLNMPICSALAPATWYRYRRSETFVSCTSMGRAQPRWRADPMNAQDIVAWGKLQPDKYFSEEERIRALCDWRRPFDLGGFVRMEFNLCVCTVVNRTTASGPIVSYYCSNSQRCHDM